MLSYLVRPQYMTARVTTRWRRESLLGSNSKTVFAYKFYTSLHDTTTTLESYPIRVSYRYGQDIEKATLNIIILHAKFLNSLGF